VRIIAIAVILLGALVLWGVGRIVIRGIVRSIERGPEWGSDQARDVLVRVKLSQYEEDSIEDRLALERRASRGTTIGTVLRAALNVSVFVLATLMILSELGLNVGPILASAGVAGVALGFGAQSLVKDLISGIFMLIEDQYGVGDVIDVGEANGLVEEVGLRVTRLRALDGTVWYVPNGEIRRVGNMTQTWSRTLIEVRFAFNTDIAQATQAMLDAVERAREDEEIASVMVGEPEVAGVESMEYNALMLRLLQQVKPRTQWTVMRAVRGHMRDIFVERGLQLAAPEGALIQSVAKNPTAARKSRAVKKPADGDAS
jgi:small conductance mechanosensitive channel